MLNSKNIIRCCLLVALVFAFTFANVAFAAPSEDVIIRFGEYEFVLDEASIPNLMSRSSTMGEHTISVSVELGIDENGNMVPTDYSGGIRPLSAGSITESGSMVSSAFKWKGEIKYDKRTINGMTGYKPVTYSFTVTCVDSQFKLVSMDLYGGATGPCVDANGNETTKSIRKSYPVSNAVSGQSYSKGYNSDYYFTAGSTIGANGKFKYKRKLPSGEFSSLYTSSEFAMNINP